MRIAFDGTALRPGRTGVGYYTEHLLHHLAQVVSNDELIVISNRAIDTTSPLPPGVRIATPSRKRGLDPAGLERVRRRYGIDDRVIRYVGTIEPRKNLPRLVEAFASRRGTGELSHQLVCVGPYGWLSRGLEDRIARLNVAHAINFTGYVPFEDLPALYSLAEMFVYPSMYEGFGLPVIEAMACGAPVITGRTPALAEIGGGAVEGLDRIEPDALGAALVALARSRDRRHA